MSDTESKKSIKPKVTIDQDSKKKTNKEGSKFGKYSLLSLKIYKSIKSKLDILTEKKPISIIIIFILIIYGAYYFSDEIKNYFLGSSSQNEANEARNLLIQEIDNKYETYNKRIIELENKDRIISELQIKVAQMNTQIDKLAIENEIRADQNEKLLELIKPLTTSIISSAPIGVDMPDVAEFNKGVGAFDNNLSASASINQDTMNIAQLLLNRIEANVMKKQFFNDELDLLASLGIDLGDLKDFKLISQSIIHIPKELIADLDKSLTENVSIYSGESKITSKLFDVLSKEVDVVRFNYGDYRNEIEKLRTYIYNDQIDEAIEQIKRVELNNKLGTLLEKLETRKIYNTELSKLKISIQKYREGI